MGEKEQLPLFWLDGDEGCLCGLPGTFSLPSVKTALLKQQQSNQRLLLDIGSKGVIDGRLFITNKHIAFFAHCKTYEDVTTSIIKIPYALIKGCYENLMEKSASILIHFRSFQVIPLRLIDNKWRNVENHKRLNEKSSVSSVDGSSSSTMTDDEDPSALFRIGDSNVCDRASAINYIKRFVDAHLMGHGNIDLLFTEAQQEVLGKLLSAKHVLPQSVVKNLAPPLYCYAQEMLYRKLGAIVIVPNGGFVWIELPSGQTTNYSFARCVFAFERLVETTIRGLEIFVSMPTKSGVDSTSTFFVFNTEADQKRFVQHLEAADPKFFSPQRDPAFLKHITDVWQQGRISNFHYLQFLNTLGGRSPLLVTRYPVYPWLVNHFVLFDTKDVATKLKQAESSAPVELEKTAASKNSANYRDLAKPIGALSHERLEALLERMSWLARKDQYLYGSHYSTPDFVAHWRLRDLPELHLRLNHGKMDHYSRLFHSITESWDSVLKGQTSFMELTPEFYKSDITFLMGKLPIQVATSSGRDQYIESVVLPVQSQCPFPLSCFSDAAMVQNALGADQRLWVPPTNEQELQYYWFLFMHRCILEGDLVSRRLHKWIDLIFGFRQRGEMAEEAFNVFHPITYVSSTLGASLVPCSSVKNAKDSTTTLDSSTLQQMEEFGQAPLQIFTQPHPARRAHLSALLMSSHSSKTLSSDALFAHFLLFLFNTCKSPVSQVLSSVSWVTLLQRCPKLLPLPSITKRLETSARSVDGTNRSQILCRLSTSVDNVKSIVTWNGLSSCKQLDRKISCQLPNKGYTRVACHSNRLAALTETGSLSIYSLPTLVAESQGSSDNKIPMLRRADHRLSSPVGPIAFSTTGSHLICGNASGCPHLINVAESTSPVKTPLCWSGHKGSITCLGINVISHRQVATGGTDESVAIWDIDTGKVETWWEGHSAHILCCCQHGEFLGSSGADSLVLLRDIRSPPWTSPIWNAQLQDGLVCTDLKIGSRFIQCVLASRIEQTAPRTTSSDRRDLVDALWRRLETLSGVKTHLRNIEVSKPKFVLSADWRSLPAALDVLSLGTTKGCHISLSGQLLPSKAADFLPKESAISAARVEGENCIVLAGTDLHDNSSFMSLLDVTTMQEIGRWPLGTKRGPPISVMGFPHCSASLSADPLLLPSSLDGLHYTPLEDPVPYMLVQSEQNVVDILV